MRVRPRLVVSGHIHGAHGIVQPPDPPTVRGITFVNAANCLNGYQIGWPPVTLTL
jgi:Icc-related predicted phosphoesterase